MSTRQLAMVESSDTVGTREGTDPARWHLDAHTRRIGLAGVAEGRRILREAAARQAAREHTSAA